MNGMDFGDVMNVLNSPNGLKQMMLKDAFQNEETGHEFSQAELIADIVNIMRMDTKRIAQAHGINIEISQMTPDRAAELLQGVAKGEDLGLVDIFDEIEDQRMMILAELEGEEAVDDYQAMKRELLHTVPNSAEIPSAEEVAEEVKEQSAEEVSDEN